MAFGIMLLSGTNEVEEVTQETVEEVGRFAQYLQDHIPSLIAFGIKVLFGKFVQLCRRSVDFALETI